MQMLKPPARKYWKVTAVRSQLLGILARCSFVLQGMASAQRAQPIVVQTGGHANDMMQPPDRVRDTDTYTIRRTDTHTHTHTD